LASAIKGSLPELGYMTLVDQYMLVCAAVLFCVALETPLVFTAMLGDNADSCVREFTFGDEPSKLCADAVRQATQTDRYCCIGLAALWLAINAFFVAWFVIAWREADSFMSPRRLLESMAGERKTFSIQELDKRQKAKKATGTVRLTA
jgi:hypothetical protein